MDVTANISGNRLYGWSAVASGPASVGSNATLAFEPTPGSAALSAVPAVVPDASSNAAITSDTVAMGSAPPSFMTDASVNAPRSPSNDPAPPTMSGMAGQVLASYANTATPSASADWADAAARASAADAGRPLGSQHPRHHGALPITDARQAAAGATGHVRMQHS